MTMKSKGKYPKTVFGHMQSFTKMNKFNLKGKKQKSSDYFMKQNHYYKSI